MMPTQLDEIYKAIDNKGFSNPTLEVLDNYINDILNGRTNLTRFNTSEHAGLCCAGAVLIGAYIVCDYARKCLESGAHASVGQGTPANWEIDEMVMAKGFKDNREGAGVNYLGERVYLEDMHPANVFIDLQTGKPTGIDCIVKFINRG